MHYQRWRRTGHPGGAEMGHARHGGPQGCVSAAPLLALLRGSNRAAAARVGVHPRTMDRWRRGAMIRSTTADRAAVALGLHPCLIWPEEESA
jgi:hypothetical protein